MSLRRFAVENYRSFRDRQELEIFPVTIVLGKNNSGKSALVRAPLLFTTSFDSGASAPIDLESFGVRFADGFTDLIFNQQNLGRLRVELGVGGGHPFSLAATIQHVVETNSALVSDFHLEASELDLRLEWVPGDSTDYMVISGQAEPHAQAVEFRGLVPSVREARFLAGGERILGPMRYLGAYRKPPDRQHWLPLGRPKGMSSNGDGVAEILAHDKVRRDGALIEIVNRYLQGITPGWLLDQEASGKLFSTILTRADNPQLRVNLVDAGTGLAQVLPTLVQCAIDELADPGNVGTLQIIEEPETHLHPAAHAVLADLYLSTAKNSGTRFLIETHSETVLLRLRRRIAETDNDFTADDVGIYVVEQANGVSTVHRVDLDSLGQLGEGWPDGYFSQDYHEVKALTAAQRARRNDAAHG